MKPIAELMKNSRRSDRKLARVLGISQPTVGRTIKKLEKHGLVRGYTMIPDFTMLGYELMALTFISINPTLDPTETEEARRTAQEKTKDAPWKYHNA